MVHGLPALPKKPYFDISQCVQANVSKSKKWGEDQYPISIWICQTIASIASQSATRSRLFKALRRAWKSQPIRCRSMPQNPKLPTLRTFNQFPSHFAPDFARQPVQWLWIRRKLLWDPRLVAATSTQKHRPCVLISKGVGILPPQQRPKGLETQRYWENKRQWKHVHDKPWYQMYPNVKKTDQCSWSLGSPSYHMKPMKFPWNKLCFGKNRATHCPPYRPDQTVSFPWDSLQSSPDHDLSVSCWWTDRWWTLITPQAAKTPGPGVVFWAAALPHGYNRPSKPWAAYCHS